MRAADFIQRFDDRDGAELLPVHADGISALKFYFHILRLVRSLFRRDAHHIHALLGFGPGIFQDPPLVADVPEIPVLAVNLFLGRRDRNFAILRIIDFIFAGFEIPFPPGCDHLELRIEGFVGEFKPYLVVAFAGASVRNGVGALPLRYFHLAARDERARKGRSEQVFSFIDGARAQRRKHKLADEFVPQIFDDAFGGAGPDSLFLQPGQFGSLPDVGGKGDDLRPVIVFQPGNDDRGVQTSAIGQNHFVRFCAHC